ncbi:hypothetical protein JCM10003_3295 [Bacteroides pyogenes JCM 10003]|nr:hypothetical protein JCM10003_3295 [Bacteroides pyogenes JCM 10003]
MRSSVFTRQKLYITSTESSFLIRQSDSFHQKPADSVRQNHALSSRQSLSTSTPISTHPAENHTFSGKISPLQTGKTPVPFPKKATPQFGTLLFVQNLFSSSFPENLVSDCCASVSFPKKKMNEASLSSIASKICHKSADPSPSKRAFASILPLGIRIAARFTAQKTSNNAISSQFQPYIRSAGLQIGQKTIPYPSVTFNKFIKFVAK